MAPQILDAWRDDTVQPVQGHPAQGGNLVQARRPLPRFFRAQGVGTWALVSLVPRVRARHGSPSPSLSFCLASAVLQRWTERWVVCDGPYLKYFESPKVCVPALPQCTCISPSLASVGILTHLPMVSVSVRPRLCKHALPAGLSPPNPDCAGLPRQAAARLLPGRREGHAHQTPQIRVLICVPARDGGGGGGGVCGAQQGRFQLLALHPPGRH